MSKEKEKPQKTLKEKRREKKTKAMTNKKKAPIRRFFFSN